MATDGRIHYRGNSRNFCVELSRIKHEWRQARWATALAATRTDEDIGFRLGGPASANGSEDVGSASSRRQPRALNLRRANERRENFTCSNGEVGCQTSALVSPAV